MPTTVQSCRIEPVHAELLARQAKRRQLEVSTLSSLYLKEKETKSVAKTANHFRWPPALVRCALDYAKGFARELAQQRQAKVTA